MWQQQGGPGDGLWPLQHRAKAIVRGQSVSKGQLVKWDITGERSATTNLERGKPGSGWQHVTALATFDNVGVDGPVIYAVMQEDAAQDSIAEVVSWGFTEALVGADTVVKGQQLGVTTGGNLDATPSNNLLVIAASQEDKVLSSTGLVRVWLYNKLISTTPAVLFI